MPFRQWSRLVILPSFDGAFAARQGTCTSLVRVVTMANQCSDRPPSCLHSVFVCSQHPTLTESGDACEEEISNDLYARFARTGTLVDTETHVGLGSVDDKDTDVFTRKELARRENCEPHERCWFDLLRMCSGKGQTSSRLRMCSDPKCHGGVDSPMHQCADKTKQHVWLIWVKFRKLNGFIFWRKHTK